MVPGAPPSTLRQLLLQAEELFARELAASAETGETRAAEKLNQAARRLRQAGGFNEICTVLADAAAGFCNSAAVFSVSGDIARLESIRGEEGRTASLEVPLAQAPAFREVMESREPAAVLGSGGQVSEAVAALMGGGRLWLVPVYGKERTLAVLAASGAPGAAALELLAQTAGLAAQAVVAAPPAVPAALVAIAPAAAPTAKAAWESLPAGEQKLHVSAQQFARVRVAEWKLYHPEAVAEGRARHDLYGALKENVDQARETFRQRYVVSCASMVDYIHLEILRALANDDPALLGDAYPGPLV